MERSDIFGYMYTYIDAKSQRIWLTLFSQTHPLKLRCGILSIRPATNRIPRPLDRDDGGGWNLAIRLFVLLARQLRRLTARSIFGINFALYAGTRSMLIIRAAILVILCHRCWRKNQNGVNEAEIEDIRRPRYHSSGLKKTYIYF